MNELALFAGAGGGILGSHISNVRTVAAVEIEPYCREVLLRRQRDGVLPMFPIWDDIRTFDGRPWRGVVDIVSAGFPCQPFSGAGKKLGDHDERNMWPDTIRVIREVGPRVVFLENVPGLLIHRYSHRIFGELAEEGFDLEWHVVGADDVGAPHIRKRLWIIGTQVGFSDSVDIGLRDVWKRNREQCQAEGQTISRDDGSSEHLANADGRRREKLRISEPTRIESECRAKSDGCGKVRQLDNAEKRTRWWEAEPDVGRVVDGLAFRVDRLKAIGNGQVPAVARVFLDKIMDDA